MNMRLTKLGLLSILLGGMPCLATALMVDEPSDPYGNAQYGNAQSTAFKKAITGGSPLSRDEQASLNAMVPKRTDQRYYVGVRLNSGPFVLERFRNRSTDTNKPGIINTKSVSTTQRNFSVLLGYQFSNAIRADVEYLSRKNLSYTAKPVLTGTGIPVQQLESTVKGNTVLMNAYYDLANSTPFTPYLSGSLGCSMYTIASTLSPTPAAGASKSTRPLKLSGGAGVGVRMRVFGSGFVDLSYRYLQLGSNLQFRANSGFMLDASQSARILGIGLSYLF